MASVSNDTVVAMFKEVYGKATNLLPEDFPLARAIPFSEKQKTGEKYVEAVVLTAETGLTLCGSGADSVNLNAARAGVVRQTEVAPYISVLGSKIPYGLISRSVDDKKSFFQATKLITHNNLKTHARFHEVFRLWGQSDRMLGYVYYGTETFRGVSFTTGTGALVLNGTSVTLTTGVNTTSKWICLGRQFNPLSFIGLEGVHLCQVDANGVVVAEGSLVAVDPSKCSIQVDFTPIAATSTTSHRICYKGMELDKEYVGIHKALSTTAGTIFGINNTNYGMYQPNNYALGATKLTLAKLNLAVAEMVNRALFEGELDVYVSPRSWATLAADESAYRKYDESYNHKEAVNGFETLKYYTQSGVMRIHAHWGMAQDLAMALYLPCWSRSGSAEVGFQVPGMSAGQDLIFPLENETAYKFNSFSDQYVFCNKLSSNLLISGINDESAS